MFITLSTRVQIGRKINWPGASRPADGAVDSINLCRVEQGQEYIEQQSAIETEFAYEIIIGRPVSAQKSIIHGRAVNRSSEIDQVNNEILALIPGRAIDLAQTNRAMLDLIALRPPSPWSRI